jgi:hypothetical protein
VANPIGAGTDRFFREVVAQPGPPFGETLWCPPVSCASAHASGEARERRSREAEATAAGGSAPEGRTSGGLGSSGFGSARPIPEGINPSKPR